MGDEAESERVRLVRVLVTDQEAAEARSPDELYTEDTRLLIPLGIDVGVYEGRTAVTDYWRQFRRTFREWGGEVESLSEVGDSVHATTAISAVLIGGVHVRTRAHYSAYFEGPRIAATVWYADWMTPSQSRAG